jgi:hypothetical protein
MSTASTASAALIASWGAAFQRWVDALNRPRDGAALSAAVVDQIQVERHGPGARGAVPVVEVFTGVGEVARWFARTPAEVCFSLAGVAWPDADGACGVEYAIDAGEFHNGGIWIARLAHDGRITWLSHHPFALREASEEPTG